MEEIKTTNVEEVKEESKFISKIKSSKKYLKYAGIAAVSVVAGALIGRASLRNVDEPCDYLEETDTECVVDESSDED